MMMQRLFIFGSLASAVNATFDGGARHNFAGPHMKLKFFGLTLPPMDECKLSFPFADKFSLNQQIMRFGPELIASLETQFQENAEKLFGKQRTTGVSPYVRFKDYSEGNLETHIFLLLAQWTGTLKQPTGSQITTRKQIEAQLHWLLEVFGSLDDYSKLIDASEINYRPEYEVYNNVLYRENIDFAWLSEEFWNNENGDVFQSERGFINKIASGHFDYYAASSESSSAHSYEVADASWYVHRVVVAKAKYLIKLTQEKAFDEGVELDDLTRQRIEHFKRLVNRAEDRVDKARKFYIERSIRDAFGDIRSRFLGDNEYKFSFAEPVNQPPLSGVAVLSAQKYEIMPVAGNINDAQSLSYDGIIVAGNSNDNIIVPENNVVVTGDNNDSIIVPENNVVVAGQSNGEVDVDQQDQVQGGDKVAGDQKVESGDKIVKIEITSHKADKKTEIGQTDDETVDKDQTGDQDDKKSGKFAGKGSKKQNDKGEFNGLSSNTFVLGFVFVGLALCTVFVCFRQTVRTVRKSESASVLSEGERLMVERDIEEDEHSDGEEC